MKIPHRKEIKKRLEQWAELSEISLKILKASIKKREPHISPKEMGLKVLERLKIGLKEKWQGPR